jgi:hypothetical protein
MNTSTQKRIARLSVLLLSALLVAVLVVPIAQALSSQSATLVQLAQAHRDRDLRTMEASASGNAAQRPSGRAWGYYYSDAGASRLVAMGAQPGHYVAFTTGGAPTDSSGISATTVWISAVAFAGVLIIVAWALVRRRRRQHEEAPGCKLSPAGC